MNGVRVRIYRDDNEETIYLSTRRSGEEGASLQALRRALRDKELKLSTMASRVQLLAAKAEKFEGADLQVLDAIVADQENALQQIAALSDEIKLTTVKVVRASLKPNYGEETEKIIDAMSDRQLRSCVTAIETGEEPKDFFQLRATPPSASTT